MRVGEMVYNILKREEDKRGEGTQRFKKEVGASWVGLSASKSRHFLWYLYYGLPLISTSADYREKGRS